MAREDPTTRMLRSGFGSQVKSQNESLPQWGFGTEGRDTTGKLYLSKEQTRAMHVSYSQGPVYKTYSAIGPQPESKYNSSTAPGFGTSGRARSARSGSPGPGTYELEGGLGPMKESKRSTSPRAVFGTATRDQQSKVWLDEELMKTAGGRDSPGPNTYRQPGGIGRMVDSKHNTAPTWRQGTENRFRDRSPSKDVPGAGTYKTYGAIGQQTLSQKKTLPSPKIGTGHRDAFKKIFISKEHEKGAFGENSPGPVTSQFVSSIGPQKLSVKSSAPSWGFGTGKRNKGFGSDTPGPGSYYA
ncbi:hypothetical protein CHLRE_06g261900v5 [Chlamydomonas reinhardtii]|uniref:Uncharacterized protein n=2 Tax=Chlamydomonas TaxID=3052 RepID=A8HXB8_CHLRE|nr:uncharacterized protein CHLRE_06g261900v5 [Chlamydomonas reinhardtii]PNW81824.1 hypothetical protein CHLRE_06g261900v5 [Chlamydomonas reinhardtii]|eukprot:XP_001696314.1 flagellar associated protein [Chlamydomonas reinhardtii]